MSRLTHTTVTINSESSPAEPVTRAWLMEAVLAALPAGHGLSPLPRLDTGPASRIGVVKAYFGDRCRCGTAAVLSVEAAASKTRAETLAAMAALVEKLVLQRDAFRKMPCAAHLRLRTAFAAVPRTAQGSGEGAAQEA
jgi:hypothetical protein